MSVRFGLSGLPQARDEDQFHIICLLVHVLRSRIYSIKFVSAHAQKI